MDVHSKEIRSYNMSKIKASNSKPELIVRKFLHAKGFRYSLHNNQLPGKPDITLKRYRTVIFINGCFRHCHQGCKYFKLPQSNIGFRENKLNKNVENDKKNRKLLKQLGRNIITIRECELKKDKIEKTLQQLIEKLASPS